MSLVLPTETEVKSMGSAAAKLLNEHRKWLQDNTPNYVGLEDTLIQSLEGPWATDVGNGVSLMRASEDAALKSGANVLLPILRTYVAVAGDARANSDAGVAFRALYEYYAANSRFVQSRVFTFGSPSAGGGNVGTGVLNRLNKDEYDFDIEAQTPDAKALKCVRDYRLGVEQGQEVFEIRGAPALPGNQWIQLQGSGKVRQIRGLTGSDSQAMNIQNPSFSIYTGTGTFTGWTQSGTIAAELTTTYRPLQGESTPVAVKLTGNGSLYQAIDDRRINANSDVPYYCQIAYNRSAGSGDGTLTLTLGNVSSSVSLGGASSGWQILRIALNGDGWYKQWAKNGGQLKIEIGSNTTGYTLIDDVIFAPMQAFDGGWYALVGGATPWVMGDTFSFTDSCTDSVLQRMFWLLFGRYLPHSTGGTVTWSDP